MSVKRVTLCIDGHWVDAVPASDYDALVSVCRQLVTWMRCDYYGFLENDRCNNCPACILVNKALALLDGEKNEETR